MHSQLHVRHVSTRRSHDLSLHAMYVCHACTGDRLAPRHPRRKRRFRGVASGWRHACGRESCSTAALEVAAGRWQLRAGCCGRGHGGGGSAGAPAVHLLAHRLQRQVPRVFTLSCRSPEAVGCSAEGHESVLAGSLSSP